MKEFAVSLLLKLPTWSTLRTLGQSKMLALSALVPFLGWLILFNQSLVDFLLLSPDWVASVLRIDPAVDPLKKKEMAQAFTWKRIYFAYFGLSLLGISSFLFTIFCPREIKRFASRSEFISGETPLMTRPQLGILLTNVCGDYLRHCSEERGGHTLLKELAYPMTNVFLFEATLNEMYGNTDMTSEVGDVPGLYSGTGNLMIDVAAEKIWAQRRAERALWMTMHATADKFVTDLLSLRFQAADFSKPLLRAFILVMYSAGFAILLYPTVTTFILILNRLLER